MLIVSLMSLAYALSFEDKTQNDFNNGTYVNATYNGTSVVLNNGNLTGTFTSRVFDAGADSIWNNLTWQGGEPSLISLFAVDSLSDIWKSANSGTT